MSFSLLFLPIIAIIPCGAFTSDIVFNMFSVTYIQLYFAISYIKSFGIIPVPSQLSQIMICLIFAFSSIASFTNFIPSIMNSWLWSLYFFSFNFFTCFTNSLSLLVITCISSPFASLKLGIGGRVSNPYFLSLHYNYI